MRIDTERRPLVLESVWTVVTLVLSLAVLMAAETSAQTFRWRVTDTWAERQIFDLECGRGGPCVAAVTYLLEVASMVRVTEDAGRTWRDVLRLDASSERFPLRINQVQAVGANTLFAAFDKGVIAVSNDAGRTWEYRRALDTGWVLVLHMKDENRGIALVQLNTAFKLYAVVATDDAWRTTRRLSPPDSILFGDSSRPSVGPQVYPTGAAVLGDDTYIVVYSASTSTVALKSTDYGQTWRTHQLGSEDIRFVRFADSLNGWAYGGRIRRAWNDSLPSVYRTTDGGETWSLTLVGSRVQDLSVRGNEVFAIANELRGYSSNDGGLTWRRDSAEIRGAVVIHTALPDTGDAIIATSSADILRSEGMPTAVDVQIHPSTSPRAWIDASGTLVVVPGSVSETALANIYDAAGNLAASLQSTSSASDRCTFALDELTLAPGAYFAVVSIQGRAPLTVPLHHW